MPEPKRPLKVFLCHASADKPAVRSLYKRLVADGVDIWLDAESLVAGQNWQVEIPKAIRESDVVIVCLSEKSINKEGYVQREIKFALGVADEKPEGTIFIIPARLEECKVPDRLNMYHWVELFERDGYERLMRALRLRADKIDATLQIKNNWLPNIASSPKRSTEIKKPPVQEAKLATSKSKGNSQIVYWLGGFVVLVLGIVLLPLIDSPRVSIESTPTNTPMLVETALFMPSQILESKATPAKEFTVTSTKMPTPTITQSPVPTATAPLLTFCSWHESFNGENRFYEFNCNNTACFGTLTIYSDEIRVLNTQLGRYPVDNAVKRYKGQCKLK